MLDSERLSVKSMLDTLADMLHVNRLGSLESDEYFESVKKYSSERFLVAIKNLQETYEPKRSTDFPVLKVVHEFCAAAKIPGEAQQSRTPEQIAESYRRRGIIVGDEAKRRLENEILSKTEAATGERIEDREHFFNGPKGSKDPSKRV